MTNTSVINIANANERHAYCNFTRNELTEILTPIQVEYLESVLHITPESTIPWVAIATHGGADISFKLLKYRAECWHKSKKISHLHRVVIYAEACMLACQDVYMMFINENRELRMYDILWTSLHAAFVRKVSEEDEDGLNVDSSSSDENSDARDSTLLYRRMEYLHARMTLFPAYIQKGELWDMFEYIYTDENPVLDPQKLIDYLTRDSMNLQETLVILEDSPPHIKPLTEIHYKSKIQWLFMQRFIDSCDYFNEWTY